MKSNLISGILVVALFANSHLHAQVPLGRWDKVAAEKPGTGLIVTLRSGERIDCSLKELTSDSITVITLAAEQQVIPKPAVQKIVTAEKRSGPLLDGVLTGAMVGGLVAIPGVIIAARSREGKEALLFLALFSGIGAGIGLAVDAAVGGNVTLYEALPAGNEDGSDHRDCR